MRYIPESWAPEHTAPMPEESDDGAAVDVTTETPAESWRPRDLDGGRFDRVAFVDGVRRRESWVVAETDDGEYCRGLLASWAAGVALCDGPRASIEQVRVERGVFCNAEGADDVTPIDGHTFRAMRAVGDSPDELSMAAQLQMLRLERAVAHNAPECDLVVIDGRLGDADPKRLTVGYVKTHQRRYGPALVSDTVAQLGAGQRTPLFTTVQGKNTLHMWYLRLPGERAHPWADIARCELPVNFPGDLAATADRVSATLMRFATTAIEDPRAPQNLRPIGALERELSHRMGDRGLFVRALRRLAA